MADSSIAITGGSVDTRTTTGGEHRQVVVLGDSASDTASVVNADGELLTRATIRPADLHVTATGAAGAAVTCTLPAGGAGRYHHLASVTITAYATAARTGSATPVLVTTTNLPGAPVWTFASAGAIGTTDRVMELWDIPTRASAANAATTIACPATTSVIWRASVRYYLAG